MNILILGKKGEAIQQDLQRNLDDSWTIYNWNPGESEVDLSNLLDKADIAITGSDALIYGGIFKFISSSKNLKLLQIPFAGVDWLNPELIPKSLMVANASGHEIAMSEYIISCVMNLSIDLLATHSDFKSGSWKKTGTLSDPKSMHGEVFGKKIGIIGYGQIGIETALRAKSLGMKTYGLNRTKRGNTPNNLDWHGSSDQLDFILKESDFLVLACDLNKSTRGLINKKTLSLMRETSYLINVARGEVC